MPHTWLSLSVSADVIAMTTGIRGQLVTTATFAPPQRKGWTYLDEKLGQWLVCILVDRKHYQTVTYVYNAPKVSQPPTSWSVQCMGLWVGVLHIRVVTMTKQGCSFCSVSSAYSAPSSLATDDQLFSFTRQPWRAVAIIICVYKIRQLKS